LEIAHWFFSAATYLPQPLLGNGIPATDHAPYRPDLAPVDCSLFPEFKSALKAMRFSKVEDIELKQCSGF
jgi:hypothetical protein